MNCVEENSQNLLEYAQLLCDLTSACAERLISGYSDIALNFYGGWHHSWPDRFSGFCFVNDVYFGIEKLKSKYEKILYIDLDVHHGDAVESTFKNDQNVFTFSAHRYEPGFFPGTGHGVKITSDEDLSGQFYNYNYTHKTSSKSWAEDVKSGINDVLNFHSFDAVVILAGADCLKYDPLGDKSKVEIEDYVQVVKSILVLKLPTLILGGGGYHDVNTAKLWTNISLMCLDLKNEILKSLPDTIPTSMDDFYEKFSPDFSLTSLNF